MKTIITPVDLLKIGRTNVIFSLYILYVFVKKKLTKKYYKVVTSIVPSDKLTSLTEITTEQRQLHVCSTLFIKIVFNEAVYSYSSIFGQKDSEGNGTPAVMFKSLTYTLY